MTTETKILKMICDCLIEAVKATGKDGAPGGVLYAALMQQGCTLNQFESIMNALVKCGKLRKQGDLYFS